MSYKIINIDQTNLEAYPQVICFINQKNEFFNIKPAWINEQFKNGLQIKLALQEETGKVAGFIEYILGENAWRAVNAPGYLFIHCLWVYPNNNKNHGLGADLINTVIKEAKALNKGVAVVTSTGSFMSKKDIFTKLGFTTVSEADVFQLLIYTNGLKLPSPSFNDYESKLKMYTGWHILYSKQCPWVARFVEEVKPFLTKLHLNVQIKELKTPKEAQNAPSIYSVFCLIKDGKLLADRYISTTRFQNIVKKEGV